MPEVQDSVTDEERAALLARFRQRLMKRTVEVMKAAKDEWVPKRWTQIVAWRRLRGMPL